MKNQKGFSLIELLIVVVIIGIIAAIAIPNLLAARRSANEASAIATLRTMTGAQATYQSSIGSGQYGTLANLQSAGLIDSVLGTTPNTKSGYVFNATVTGSGAGQPAVYNLGAIPQQHGTGVSGTGSRSFYTNEAGVIYFNATAAAPAATSSTDRSVPSTSGLPLNN